MFEIIKVVQTIPFALYHLRQAVVLNWTCLSAVGDNHGRLGSGWQTVDELQDPLVVDLDSTCSLSGLAVDSSYLKYVYYQQLTCQVVLTKL